MSNKSMILCATIKLFFDTGRGFMVANVRLSLDLKRALWYGSPLVPRTRME